MQKSSRIAKISTKVVGGLLFYVHPVHYNETSIRTTAKQIMCIAGQYCHSRPCKNGGTCAEDAAHHTYKCKCSAGFTGKQCQTSKLSQCLLTVAACTYICTDVCTPVTVSSLHVQHVMFSSVHFTDF